MKPLTRREREVLTHLCAGLSPKEIAILFAISIKTVETHISNIQRKAAMGNATRIKLFIWAIEHGHVNAPERRVV